jgi:hypothetical protein
MSRFDQVMLVLYTLVGVSLPVVFAFIAPVLYAGEDDDLGGSKPSDPDDGMDDE